MRSSRRRRSGIGVGEVVLVLVLVIAVGLVVAMALPRGREKARGATCENNLRQIGVALSLYAKATGHYPTVPAAESRGASPLAALLVELGQADFSRLGDPKSPPAKHANLPTGSRLIPGFLCPTDPEVRSGRFSTPLSYRVTAGSTPSGDNGPFAPGRLVTPEQVASGDGLSYTAACSERLLGTGRDGETSPRNYALVPGPIGPGDCPSSPLSALKGDAGMSWTDAGWRSSLYNHTIRPNAPAPCIADDGRTAKIGASSGHNGLVHVLLLDGGTRSFTSTIDPEVWKGWANFQTEAKPTTTDVPKGSE
ncbi:MAG: DUF1559 domain-containing protein [Isosphaeraceae bacterium]